MNIHQLSVIHEERQDRLSLKLNTQDGHEFRFWLTRRMAIRLVPALEHSIERLEAAQPGVAAADESAQKMLTELKRDAFLQTANFSTPYSSEPQTLPLGDQPMLVTDAQLNLQADGCLQITFQEKRDEGTQSCLLNLKAPLVHGMIHLVRQAMQKADWGGTPATKDQISDDLHANTPDPKAYKH